MPPPYWRVYKGVLGSQELLNIQQVNVTQGRRVLSDSYAAGTASIEGRRPDLLPALNIGDLLVLQITNPNTSPASTRELGFRVADFRITYGIISDMDTWILQLEDAFAVMGRARMTQTWSAGTSIEVVLGDVCSAASITFYEVVARDWGTVGATTVTNGSCLETAQNAINTEQGLLFASGDAITAYTNGWQQYLTFADFSDAGGAATRYQQLQFMSMADNYATRVTVTIDGTGGATSGTGNYSYLVDTYAPNTAQAQNIAEYLKGALSVQSAGPIQMTVFLNDETSTRTLNSLLGGVNITFRGNSYKAQSIGYTISSDVNTTRVTLNLSSADFYNFLVLDNATFGRLDYNRLGF